MDPELEEQMKMLEGLDLGNDAAPMTNSMSVPAETIINSPINVTPDIAQAVSQPVTTAQTVAQTTAPVTPAPVQPAPQPVNTVAPVQPMSQPIVNTTPAQTVTEAAPQNLDLNQAPVFVNLAASAYQTKTNFLSLKDGERTRVTLANLNFIRNHIHYIDGLGKIRCLSGYDENNKWPVNRAACCRIIDEKTGKEQNAKNRLLVPVVEYPVSKTDGKTIVQGDVPKLKMWDMNYLEEKQLMDILENYKTGDDWSSIDTSSFDLALIKGKSGEFSTITLTPMPSWKANFAANINAEIAKIDQDFYTTAYKESARTVTEQSISNAIAQKMQQDLAAQQLMNQQIPDMGAINLNM